MKCHLLLGGFFSVLLAIVLPASAGESPPGSNFGFYGTGATASDPLNSFNDVASVDTTGGKSGGLLRTMGDQVTVDQLTDELELKYFLVGRSCGGGSPRISLLISPSGKPNDPAAAEIFGYVGGPTFGGGCPSNLWTYQDLSQGPQWDLTKFGQGYGNTWAQVVAYFKTAYPNHRVLQGFLDDDSSSFFAGDAGCAYYDLVSIGARTYTNHSDGSGNGQAANACPGAHH